MSSGTFALALLRRQCRCRSGPQLLQHRLPTSSWASSMCLDHLTSHDTPRGASQVRLYASMARGLGKQKEGVKGRKGRGSMGDVEEDGNARELGKHGKGPIDTTQLVSRSQRVLSGEDQAEYARTKERMVVAVEWLRREVGSMEARGMGRVSPDILKSVRVALPGASVATPSPLLDVATVGVRDGAMLIVTAFEENNLRHIEKAIYAAQIPHVAPQKVDNRTLRIPLPKPTVDARNELVKAAAKLAEETRIQLRRHEQSGIKKMKYEKHSIEIEQFRDLLLNSVKNVDKIINDMKKNFGIK